MMFFLAVAPLFFAFSHWLRKLHSVEVIDRNIELLLRLKQICRSSSSIPKIQVTTEVAKVVGNAVELGFACSNGLTQAAIWLRQFKVQALKHYKLASLWIMRLTAVSFLSLCVRFYFTDSISEAMFGVSTSDQILLISAGLCAFAGTVVFFKLVPNIDLKNRSEVSELASWLEGRIFVESGHPVSFSEKLSEIELREVNSGITLIGEKIEVLDDVWRQRIFSLEKSSETASEFMPFLELVFFGLFILCVLLEPGLKFAG